MKGMDISVIKMSGFKRRADFKASFPSPATATTSTANEEFRMFFTSKSLT